MAKKKKKFKKKSNNKTASSLQLVIRVEVKHARPSTSSKQLSISWWEATCFQTTVVWLQLTSITLRETHLQIHAV